MKLLTIILVLSLVGLNINAESRWVDDAIRAEIENETSQSKKSKSGQNIFIVNKNDSNAKAINNTELEAKVINQQETIVEASPLVESYASNLRKMRQNAEIETEQKIVEKLESARLEDERNRAQRLFGHKQFQTPQAQTQMHTQAQSQSSNTISCRGNGCYAPVEQAPVQIIERSVIQQQVRPISPTVVPVRPVETTVVPTINYETKPADTTNNDNIMSKSFISAGLGGASYDADNVDSEYVTQLGLGLEIDKKLSVEATFAYSKHMVEEYFGYSNSKLGSYGFTDLKQYNWGLEGQYKFITRGSLSLYVGGHLGLTYRSYNGTNTGHGDYGQVGSKSSEETKSVNIAPVLGVDFNLTKNVSIGLNYKYMISVAQEYSSDALKTEYNDPYTNTEYVPLEDVNYSIFSINAKIRF